MSRIVVLGAGESGAGAAVLAKVKGFDTFVSDMSAIKDKYKELLDKHGIVWEEGQHTEELILNADEVVKSPGIPNDAPLILKLKEKSIPIISEIEFAGRYTDAKMICITGSNGKTTTTSLIYHIFKSAGLNVGLAGNIGNSLALQVAMEKHDYYVIELSSFQLDNMYKFRANIAVLMNITPDHLDRYDHCMQKYVDAKFRITQNQTPEDAFIYWNDDPIIRRELEKHSDEFNQGLLGNSESFIGAMTYHMPAFYAPSLYTAMNELDNHDHSRFLTRTNHRVGRVANVGPYAAAENTNKAVLREAVVIQMTWPGAPTL